MPPTALLSFDNTARLCAPPSSGRLKASLTATGATGATGAGGGGGTGSVGGTGLAGRIARAVPQTGYAA